MLNRLPAHARIWIYQADRELSPSESEAIQQQLNSFTGQWTAHTMQLSAAAEVVENRFVIIGVDEQIQSASGCSIDSSVRLIKALEQTFAVHFFDRLAIAFEKENRIQTVQLPNIKTAVNEGVLAANTLVYNNMVSTLAELQTSWKLPLQDSWLKRYLN